MKHSVFAKIATLALALVLILSLAACGKKSDSGVKILVPNDTTNEARALLLLQENGIITLIAELNNGKYFSGGIYFKIHLK